jgi:hypothetical protein
VSSPTVTPQLQRLAAQAAHDPKRVFTTLAHLSDVDFLHEAYRHTSKSSAVGIDGITAKRYAEPLGDNLRDVHERLRSGRYQAAPVERVWIEKDDGGQRPIGQPAFEAKIVQRAVAMRLAAIDAQDFSDCSYGFRPGRSPHEALHEIRERCMREGIGWSVDADVSGYFDSINRTPLPAVLRQRVNDGRIRRLIGKWLRAGVREDGVLTHPETGVVQGGVLSPPTKLQTFFFEMAVTRIRVDPKDDVHLVAGDFPPFAQRPDEGPFARPVGCLSPVLEFRGKILQPAKNQLQFPVQGGLVRPHLTLFLQAGKALAQAGNPGARTPTYQ